MSAQGGATGSVHVNVFGGPGSGKSTMAYAVAAELKARGYTAECVGEVVKDCIYEGSRSLYINPNECVDCGACEPDLVTL